MLTKTQIKRINKTVAVKRSEEGFNHDNRVFVCESYSRKFRDMVLEVRIPSLKYSRRGYNAGRIRTVKIAEVAVGAAEFVVNDVIREVGTELAVAVNRTDYRVYDDRFHDYDSEDDQGVLHEIVVDMPETVS